MAIALAVVLAVVLSVSRAVAVEAVYPVERARQAFALRVWTRVCGFFRGAEARAENVRLRREAASLALLKGDMERLEAENERLRKALSYAQRHATDWVAAGVLSRQGGVAARDVLRVDKGTLAGIRVGAVVAVPDGLVGKVTSVTLHTAEVTLITASSLKVACEIETSDAARLRGILCGGNEDQLLLRHLPEGVAEVPPRSRVLTSGLGGVFPRGIEVGTWVAPRAHGREAAAWEGEVLPAVDFSSLEDVFIRHEK